jgi:hypothetical protein
VRLLAREVNVRARVQGNAARARQQEHRLLRIVETFPLPAAAPEAEMVGAAIRDRFTGEELEVLLKSLVRAALPATHAITQQWPGPSWSCSRCLCVLYVEQTGCVAGTIGFY